MTFATYTTGIPNPPNNPSNDVAPMQTNCNSISALFAIDHMGFNNNIGGWHNLTHLVPQNLSNGGPSPLNPQPKPSNPAVSGVTPGIIFANATTLFPNDPQLMYLSPGGGINIMTGSSPTFNGYGYMAGILVQWGMFNFPVPNSPFGTNTVPFSSPNVNFPTNCFVVILTLISSTITQSQLEAADTLAVFSKSQTGFKYTFLSDANNGTNIYPGFYWVAIGN